MELAGAMEELSETGNPYKNSMSVRRGIRERTDKINYARAIVGEEEGAWGVLT